MKRLITKMLSSLGYEFNSKQHIAAHLAPWVGPGHFYSPYPDLQEIRRDENRIFSKDKWITDVDLNEQDQLEQLKTIAALYPTIPFREMPSPGLRYHYSNSTYAYSDGIILHAMLRLIKPRVLMEVGSGYSSAATLDTNELCFSNKIQVTFIEPYPELLLSLMKPGDKDRVTLITSKLQDVDVSVFEKLTSGDILFIDSTHVSKVNSDVNMIFFEILPRLQSGVFIHFHDVFYPFEYPMDWVYAGRAWQELYLIRMLLQRPTQYRIKLFQDFMFHKQRSFYEQHLPLCTKNSGGNLWLEKI